MTNVVVLMGRLVADPELRQTQSGISVTGFSIAVDRNRADADGNRQADFFNVVAWRGTAEFICKYFSKGSMISIDGCLQSRKYQDKQGNNRTAIEVLAQNASFCGGKNHGSSESDEYKPSGAVSQPNSPSNSYGDGFEEISEGEDFPF